MRLSLRKRFSRRKSLLNVCSDMLLDLLRLISVRKTKLQSLIVMYQWKLVDICGYMPSLHGCGEVRRPESEDNAGRPERS